MLEATSSWMDNLLVSHQHPSLSPPSSSSSSSLCAEEHKLSNTSTAAHVSSVLQLSAPCLHTEGFERADWAHNKHTAQFLLPTGYCFSFCILDSATNTHHLRFCFVFFSLFCFFLIFFFHSLLVPLFMSGRYFLYFSGNI